MKHKSCFSTACKWTCATVGEIEEMGARGNKACTKSVGTEESIFHTRMEHIDSKTYLLFIRPQREGLSGRDGALRSLEVN